MNLIRSNTLFVLSVLILFSACNESKKKQLTSAKNLYYQANKNNDYVTGLVALNEIILLDSTVGAFHDSISRIYLAQGNYKAALHFGQMVLEKKPDYQKMIELVGLSHEALGNHQNAIDKFASLYLRTGLLKYQYEIGKIELSRQNFQGGDSVMQMIVSDTSGDNSTVDMQTSSGKVAKISTIAAANYLQGVLLVEREQKINSGAKKMKKALSIEPNFELAIQYLQEVERYQQMLRYQQRP